MTDRFKDALYSLNKLTGRHGTLSYVEMGEWICEYCQEVRTALTLATESEQLRKRLADLENALERANKKIQWYERTEAKED